MKPQDVLRFRDKKQEADEAAKEPKEAKEAAAKVERHDPGTPEEWESLDLTKRFDDLWQRIKSHVGELGYESETDFIGQTGIGLIEIDHEGNKQRIGLFFALSKDEFHTSMTAHWVQGPQEIGDRDFTYNEQVYNYKGLKGLSETEKQHLQTKLNNLYHSLQAYETAPAMVSSS